MILQIEDWIFEIDMEKTKKHSLQEAAENCQCAYCRNFYRALDSVYRELKSKLLSFGICAEAPEKMNPTVFSEEQILYDPMYYVFGRIAQKGTGPFLAGFVSVYPSDQEEMLDGSAVFRLQAKGVNCPWALDEPFTGVLYADQGDLFSATLQ